MDSNNNNNGLYNGGAMPPVPNGSETPDNSIPAGKPAEQGSQYQSFQQAAGQYGQGNVQGSTNNTQANNDAMDGTQTTQRTTGYSSYNFDQEIDPFYTEALKKQKKNSSKKVMRNFGIFAASIFCMASVSAASIYVYDQYYLDKSGAPVETQSDGNSIVYLPTTSKEALTTPQIYDKTIDSVVAIKSVQQNNGYLVGSGTGTGIIMTEDGYILTNAHVVESAGQITVTTSDGVDHEATVIGSDSKVDIAVLKIEATGLQAATFGDSNELVHGEPAIVIGNPLGMDFAGTVTEGIISSTSREVSIGNYIMKLVQTNAAINPGNSGGPLINSRGQVVGVVSSKIASEEVEGIGFAIPTDIALSVANDFIEYGYVKRPMMGITVEEIDRATAQINRIESGLRVASVQDGSAADKAGMLPGDRILKINDVDVYTLADLDYEKDKYGVGETITLGISRDGERLTVELTLMENTEQ